MESYRDAPELVDYETPNFEHINELRVLDSIAREGGMQAIRIPTIAKDQIFALGINDRSELLWWTRIGDPRVVRKETADSEGRMQARLYHESTTQIWIDVPDSDDISEVRLYLPGSGPGHVVLVPLYTVPFHISQ